MNVFSNQVQVQLLNYGLMMNEMKFESPLVESETK